MLRHKAMIQCARIAFGFGGIYDQDEAERIQEAGSPPLPDKPPEQQAFEDAHLQDLRDAAMDGLPSLTAAFNELPLGALKTAFWKEHGDSLKTAAGNAKVIEAEAV